MERNSAETKHNDSEQKERGYEWLLRNKDRILSVMNLRDSFRIKLTNGDIITLSAKEPADYEKYFGLLIN